jgi:hypothetical protein
MVFVKTDWGGFHEPPYTEEEILETARRTAGAVAFRSHQHRQPPRAQHGHGANVVEEERASVVIGSTQEEEK